MTDPSGMNRAQRRQLARKNGWEGTKAKKTVPFDQALAEALAKERQSEQERYVAKITEAARNTRDMGLVIPGQ